jgi:hypothetical protein
MSLIDAVSFCYRFLVGVFFEVIDGVLLFLSYRCWVLFLLCILKIFGACFWSFGW